MKEHATFREAASAISMPHLDICIASLDNTLETFIEAEESIRLASQEYQDGELPGILAASLNIGPDYDDVNIRYIDGTISLYLGEDFGKIDARKTIQAALQNLNPESTLTFHDQTETDEAYDLIELQGGLAARVYVREESASEMMCDFEVLIALDQDKKAIQDDFMTGLEFWSGLQSELSELYVGDRRIERTRPRITISDYKNVLPKNAESYDLWLDVISADPHAKYDSDQFSPINYGAVDFDDLARRYGHGEDIRESLAQIAKSSADLDLRQKREVGSLNGNDIGIAILHAKRKRLRK